MTRHLFTTIISHIFVFLVTITCLLFGHYLSHILSVKFPDPSPHDGRGYLTTLENDLQTMAAHLPRMILKMERAYMRHDAAVRHVGATVSSHLLGLARTCFLNRLTGSLMSLVLRSLLVSGYLAVAIMMLAVLGPVAAKLCLLFTIFFSVTSRLCLDTGLFVVKQINTVFGGMRRLLEGEDRSRITDAVDLEPNGEDGGHDNVLNSTDIGGPGDINYPTISRFENNDLGRGASENRRTESVASIFGSFMTEDVSARIEDDRENVGL